MILHHPYANLSSGQWLRGNLHTHTTRSDGTRDPQAVLDDYARRGYNYLMISDHDIYTGPEEYAGWDTRGMIMIPGNEVTANGPHILHVDARSRIEPHADRQLVFDAVGASHGFAIANHPNWRQNFNHCPQELLEQWQGYRGIEIYNGVIGRLDGSPYATDKWDRLLSAGRYVWGYANDDSHKDGDAALGWNYVYAMEPTAQGVVDALAAGRFYASTGVVIRTIEVNGSRVRIETENADRIIGFTRHQKRFAVVDRPEIELDLADCEGLEGYVRFECHGRGEQIAWTQPMRIEA